MISVPLPIVLLGLVGFYWLGSSMGRFVGRQEATVHALILIKGFARRKSLVYPELLSDFAQYITDMGRELPK
jgi:hypothetical protein